jgi:hypothetical protein
MNKFRLKLNLQLFADELEAVDPGVDNVPAAEVQTETPQVENTSEPGAEPEVAAEPEKQNNFEKAFAKRLAEAEKKWQAETAEKYKDYDVLQKATAHLQKTSGITDLMTLKEELELADLQERAEKQNLDPETLKRIEQLEQKAAKVDEFEQLQQQEQVEKTYFSTLGEFVKDKGVSPEELNQFMIENELTYNPDDMSKSFNIALKAMKADQFEQQAKEKESETISRYLASKSSPKVEGSTGAASSQAVDTSKMSWKDLERHAAARLDAAKTPQ